MFLITGEFKFSIFIVTSASLLTPMTSPSSENRNLFSHSTHKGLTGRIVFPFNDSQNKSYLRIAPPLRSCLPPSQHASKFVS